MELDINGEKTLAPQDVANILHISKSTVYNMVNAGDISSYRVGRKVRFSEEDVRQYIEKSRNMVAAGTPFAAPVDSSTMITGLPSGFVICGQDLVLDVLSNYMRLYGVQALRAYIDSYDSLVALYKRRVNVASSHLWDGQHDEYNNAYVKRLVPGTPTVIIHLIHRMQGLYVRSGNPKGITGWEDFGRDDITMVNREYGAGARVLLDENLKLLGLSGHDIKGYDKDIHSHLAVASAVAGGQADIAVGNEKIAKQVDGIDFIPMKRERYDLVVRAEDKDTNEIQTMLQVLRSKPFKDEFDNIGGYDTAGMGEIAAEL